MNTIKEDSSNAALKLLSCRACLATDIKLFNIYENQLADAFAHITGTPVLLSDGLPQHLCCYCRGALLKCRVFRARSLRAQQCLRTVTLQIELTTDYIRTIDRRTHKLIYLTKNRVETTDYRDTLEVDVKKEESDTDFIPESDDLKMEYEINDKIEGIDHTDFSDDNTEQIFVATNPVKDVKVRKRKKKKEEKRVKKKIKKRTSDNDYLPDFDFAKFESSYSVEIIALTKEQQLEEIRARKQSANYQYAAYKCEECGKGFMANDAYNNHKTRHSPSMGAHACEICLVRFKRQSRRQEHQDLHRLKFLCKECSFVSRNRYQAKKHFEWHSGKIHVCKHCGASFTKSSTYLSHVRLQHPAMNVACDVCGETFVGRLGLLQHKSRAHQVTMVKPESVCAECGAQFESTDALGRHTRAPCDPQARPCLACGETLSTEEELQAHTKERHSTDQFKCLQVTVAEHGLGVHRLSVNLRRPCLACGETLYTEEELQAHTKERHSTDQFKCLQVTVAEHGLGVHRLSVNLRRPCLACGATLSTEEELQAHTKERHSTDQFKCLQVTVAEHGLGVHMLSVNLRRPCLACGETLYTEEELQAHTKERHSTDQFKCLQVTVAEHGLGVHRLSVNLRRPCLACGATLSTEEELQAHTKERHSTDQFKCLQVTVAEHGLGVHRLSVNLRRPCLACGPTLSTEEELQAHTKERHSTDQFKCLQVTEAEHGLGVHRLSVNLRRPCLACGATLSTEEELQAHTKERHSTDQFKCLQVTVAEHGLGVHRLSVNLRRPCLACGETLSTEEELQAHTKERHSTDQFKCLQVTVAEHGLGVHRLSVNLRRPCLACGETLSTEEELQAHTKERHSTDQFKCLQVTVAEHGLGVHRLSVNLRRPCLACGETLSTEEELQAHTKERHSTDQFKCLQVTVAEHGLGVHRLSVNLRRPCLACGETLSTEEELQAHTKERHSTDQFKCLQVTVAEHGLGFHRLSVNLRRPCLACGETLSTEEELQAHTKERHSTDQFKCLQVTVAEHGLGFHRLSVNLRRPCLACGETLSTEEELQAHTKERHSTDQFKCLQVTVAEHGLGFHRLSVNLRRPCLACGETLSTEEELQAHTKERHSTDQYKCLQCDKIFASSKSYEVHHQRVHLNVRWRKARDKRARRTNTDLPKRKEAMCEVCGKACESNAALVYHQRSHTGERPYKCAQCPKSFTMPQALINHQLVHSDERPYMCSACPKAFKQKVALQLHSRVHTGERPYKCSLCDSSFKQGPHLNTHVKLMHHAPDRRPRRKL